MLLKKGNRRISIFSSPKQKLGVAGAPSERAFKTRFSIKSALGGEL